MTHPSFGVSNFIPSHWEEAWLSALSNHKPTSFRACKQTNSIIAQQQDVKMDIDHFSHGTQQSTSIRFQVIGAQPDTNQAMENILFIKEWVWDHFEQQVLNLSIPSAKTILRLQDTHRMIVCLDKTFVSIKFPFNIAQGWCTITAQAQPYAQEAIFEEMECAASAFPHVDWEVVYASSSEKMAEGTIASISTATRATRLQFNA